MALQSRVDGTEALQGSRLWQKRGWGHVPLGLAWSTGPRPEGWGGGQKYNEQAPPRVGAPGRMCMDPGKKEPGDLAGSPPGPGGPHRPGASGKASKSGLETSSEVLKNADS